MNKPTPDGLARGPATRLQPFVTAGDPNISRAFRIAVGDIASNVTPLEGAASLTAAPLSKKRWETLSAKVVEIYGTRDVIPDHPSFLIAGLDYGMYQFDTMMHAWDGASFLATDAVKGALFATLVMSENGHVRSGDFITGFGWTVGAWSYYLHMGDRAFLKVALAATLGAFEHYERVEFDPQLNLFRGPAILCDGISSYPDFWVKGLTGTGHIIKWPDFHPSKKAVVGLGLPMHALSTQCINCQAYLIAARMQRELGLPVDPSLEEKAARLKAAINEHFWREDAGLYRYLVDPFGGSDQQEGFGNAFAILFGIASPEQTKRVLAAMHVTPHGIPINWPAYPRYASPDGMTYGNHNATLWPPVSGVWAQAAAQNGRLDLFALELKPLADRACRDNQFAEVYHPVTGQIYGGIQEGMTGRKGAGMRAFIAARLGGDGEPAPENLSKLFPPVAGKEGINVWQACGRNTFSATAYLRMVLHGLCGIRLDTDGLSFSPSVPKGMSPVAVYDLPYRQAVLEIQIRGEGQTIRKITVNGREHRTIPVSATGRQVIVIEMGS
ncbi:MAG: hypothetical protein FJ279_05275 [Planctomycetes bacterium]|nr:hypothetical protein [Planctomycetota bacterium]